MKKFVLIDHDGGISVCGGVAIFLRNNIYYEQLNIQSPLQHIAIRASIPYPITICNIYLPDQNVQKTEILHIISQLPRPFLLLGDLNANNELWKSATARNNNGKIIEEILMSDDSNILLNIPGIPTHFNFSSRTESTIDLSFADSRLASKVRWSADSELHGSDHYPIYLKLPSTKEKQSLKPKWIFHKADWGKFSENTSLESPVEQISTLSVDELIEKVNNEILQAAELSIPQSHPPKDRSYLCSSLVE